MNEQSVTTASPGEVYWRYTIPARSDSKMLLLNLGGVAIIGNWYGKLGEHFLAWCPLPKRDKAVEREVFGGLQKLREALQIGRDYVAEALAKHDQQYLRHPATEGERKLICADLTLLEQAFATTEPEPTGMPELPKPDEIGDRWLSSHVYTSDQMRTYGELCWKAGAADRSHG